MGAAERQQNMVKTRYAPCSRVGAAWLGEQRQHRQTRGSSEPAEINWEVPTETDGWNSWLRPYSPCVNFQLLVPADLTFVSFSKQ